jgi:DNA-binding FadR family transcriptional regulator
MTRGLGAEGEPDDETPIGDGARARSGRGSLTLSLVDELGRRMRLGPLHAGDKLPTEAALKQEFGVSRTVVREALSRLQAAGMVKTRQGVGAFVVGATRAKPFAPDMGPDDSLAEALAMLELRAGLESEAAALAAQRRTPKDLQALGASLQLFQQALEAGADTAPADFQFHLSIARAAHSPHFAAVLEAFGPHCVSSSLIETPSPGPAPPRWASEVLQEHASIVEGILAQDVDAARAAMRVHLIKGRERRRAASASRSTQG